MSVITGAQLKTVVDSMAAQKILLDNIVGAVATASTILYGMQQNADRIGGYDEDVIADLFDIFVNEKDLIAQFKTRLDVKALQKIDSHIRRLEDQGFSDYWEAQNYPTNRVPPETAQIIRANSGYVKAIIVYPPVTVMGTFLVSGVGAGTFTDGLLIDVNLYGPGNCELEVTAKGGASVSLVATVTGTDEDGNAVTGEATFAAADVGDKVAVTPDQAGKKFQDITTITITGGAADDAFKIQSKVDRVVTL